MERISEADIELYPETYPKINEWYRTLKPRTQRTTKLPRQTTRKTIRNHMRRKRTESTNSSPTHMETHSARLQQSHRLNRHTPRTTILQRQKEKRIHIHWQQIQTATRILH